MHYSVTSPYHRIFVEDAGPLRILRFEHNRQSSMYLDAPFDTDFEYPSYFHLALAIQPKATRTLVIGLGGGTVVKRMWRDYPDMTLDVVELDREVVDVARRFFALPEDDEYLHVHVGDGREFVERSDQKWDIAIIDAFDDDKVPRPLQTEEFMHELRAHLSQWGVVAYNFIGSPSGDYSRPFRSLHRTLANVWRHVWVFVAAEGVAAHGSNIIVLASDATVPYDELHRRIEDRVGGRVTVPAFDSFGNDLYLGAIRSGDVPIIVDPPKRRRRERPRD